MTEPHLPAAGEWRTAVISEVQHPNRRTVRVRLDVPGRSRQLPGQHYVVRLTAEDGYTASRSYSVSSAPSAPMLEMLIEKLDGGEVSGYFADVARPGDLVEVRGPIGRWFVWNGRSPALAVGGGTGVAPIVAMVRHARETGATELFTPVVAARTIADLPFADEFVAAGATIVLSQQGFRARPAGRLSAADLKPLMAQGQTSYVCGSAGFAESASQLLVSLGVDVGSVRVERFGFSGG